MIPTMKSVLIKKSLYLGHSVSPICEISTLMKTSLEQGHPMNPTVK